MSNLHRIQWIDGQIRSKRYPNCRTIADQFEISNRQASRDVEYLRYSMGAPVEYSYEKNGYYYSNDAFSLPMYYISQEEKINLRFLAEQYRAINNVQATRLAELFLRLTGPDKVERKTGVTLPVYPINRALTDVFNQLKTAMEKHTAIQMVYLNSANEKSDRLLHPYKLFQRKGNLYVVGFCQSKNALRIFRLDRIVSIVPANMVFSVVSYFNPDDYENAFSFQFKTPYVCRILSMEAIDFRKFRFTQKHEENYLYTVEFFTSEGLLSHLLSQSTSFTILSPVWLKEKLKDRVKKILSLQG